MEHWVEVNLHVPVENQDGVLLDVLWPYVRRLRRGGDLVTYHFFREPEIRFRVRLATSESLKFEEVSVAKIAEALMKKGLLREWHFGNHGLTGEKYSGEEDRYGKNGWKVAQDYFELGSETALRLIELKRKGALENPLWGLGTGNPWEGGDENPWKDKEEDPLSFHWSRYVHLISNQLGFDIGKEVKLCDRQARNYSKVLEMGMRW